MANLADASFGIAELASAMGVSERTLGREIKRIAGITPLKYVRELKLQEAQRMLRAKEYGTVAEVCYAVGFEKPSYFTQLFVARFGEKPSSYLQ